MGLTSVWTMDNFGHMAQFVPPSEGATGWQRSWRQDPSVFPGDAATREAIRRSEERDRIISLIHKFAAHGISWGGASSSKISPPTAGAAELFVRALPANKAFPKISPDGDGGLMMLWEGVGDPFLVTLYDLHLSAVIAAATPRAQYLDEFPPFDRAEIPSEVLAAIPSR